MSVKEHTCIFKYKMGSSLNQWGFYILSLVHYIEQLSHKSERALAFLILFKKNKANNAFLKASTEILLRF